MPFDEGKEENFKRTPATQMSAGAYIKSEEIWVLLSEDGLRLGQPRAECSAPDADDVSDFLIGQVLHPQATDLLSLRHQPGQTVKELIECSLVADDFIDQRRGIRSRIQHGYRVAILVFIFIVEGQHVSGTTELSVKAVTITEPELVFRASTLAVVLSLLAEGIVVAGVFAVVILRDFHPLLGGLEIDAVGFTLVGFV